MPDLIANIFDLLRAEPAVFITVSVVLGLMIGSFLNVVIYRLPKMMEREWRKGCQELQGLDPAEEPKLNLAVPRSACPGCGHRISSLENIPVCIDRLVSVTILSTQLYRRHHS